MQSTRTPLRAVLCIALFILLTGCASLTEFIEEYYRAQGTIILAAQNKVLGALFYAIDVLDKREDFEIADKLDDVQEKLGEACSSLWDVAILNFEGEEADDDLGKEAIKSFDSCEEATLKAEGEMYRIAPELAASYPMW